MKTLLFISVLSVSLNSWSMGTKPKEPVLEVVPYVDVQRYLGTWYEIARCENSFQKGCVGTTATYSLRDDGDINVLNRCYINEFDGKLDEANGRAWVVDGETNAKLKVQFFWPFSGDYWIIDLDSDYRYAVVSEPNRKYLWILSRTPQMDSEVYEGILERLKSKKFNLDKLLMTPQKSD